jgi:transposase
MTKVSIVGMDLGKNVFQVHGVDETGRIAVQRKLPRADVLSWLASHQQCLVGMEAGAAAHYGAREIAELGHEVRLMHPSYVKPYVKRQKNDRVDAAAICEAVGQPTMRFASIKTKDQQAVQVLHRSRELLTQQKIQLSNALHAHLAEFGYVFARRGRCLRGMSAALSQAGNEEIPLLARRVLRVLMKQFKGVSDAIARLDKRLLAWHRAQSDSQRLATIPGIGVLTATAIIGAIGDGRQFRSGRDFSAWIGLVPRQHSSGGKDRLGRISKRGNAYLRRLLVIGATMQLVGNRWEKAPGGAWFGDLRRRKPARLATVALANKLARIAWAVLTRGGTYRTELVRAPDEEACHRGEPLAEGKVSGMPEETVPPAG